MERSFSGVRLNANPLLSARPPSDRTPVPSSWSRIVSMDSSFVPMSTKERVPTVRWSPSSSARPPRSPSKSPPRSPSGCTPAGSSSPWTHSSNPPQSQCSSTVRCELSFFATIFVDARLFASSSVWRTAWAESRRSAVDARRVVRIEQERGATAAWRMSLPASTDCGMK